jgi:hypothetical protein
MAAEAAQLYYFLRAALLILNPNLSLRSSLSPQLRLRLRLCLH